MKNLGLHAKLDSPASLPGCYVLPADDTINEKWFPCGSESGAHKDRYREYVSVRKNRELQLAHSKIQYNTSTTIIGNRYLSASGVSYFRTRHRRLLKPCQPPVYTHCSRICYQGKPSSQVNEWLVLLSE